MYNIIRKKRDGEPLSYREISEMILRYTSGEIPDYQMSAFLMAVYFNGMNEEEISFLTEAMAKSGDIIDLSELGSLSCDKHSTGGVGDKTSLITVPVAAALGCKVAKMSGRGLGHTGGTADKLEAIPGYRITMSMEDFISQTKRVGIALATQSGNLAPADKKIYALRDVTGTVDSMPLIASSIMSKKIAAGAKNIVLDVKVGSGAFMKSVHEARELAACMVKIGKSCGRNVRAVITDMDVPLGNAVGNTLEVIEAAELLQGKRDKRLLDICCVLAAHMASMALGIDEETALNMAYSSIEDGSAFKKFKEWISAQGGDLSAMKINASIRKEIRAEKSGYITAMDAQKIGEASVVLGAGRRTKAEEIDYSAGIILVKKTGDSVKKGDVIARLFTNRENEAENAVMLFSEAVEITPYKPQEKPLIYEVIQ